MGTFIQDSNEGQIVCTVHKSTCKKSMSSMLFLAYEKEKDGAIINSRIKLTTEDCVNKGLFSPLYRYIFHIT